MNQPLISVIVPVYNVETYLNRCLDSIINQSYKNLEIILIDDGSTDNSGLICDNYKELDNRIVVLHKNNGGVSFARNCGLDVCKGEYVAFVDSDDWIHAEFISKLYDCLKEYGADISVCSVYRTFLNKPKKVNQLFKNRVLSPESFYELGSYFYCWNKLYKKYLFNEIRFKEGVRFEDAYIYCDIIYKAKSVATTSSILYYYYDNSDSFTSHINKSGRYYLDLLESRHYILEFAIKNNLNEKILNLYYFIYFLSYSQFIIYSHKNKNINVSSEIKYFKKVSSNLLPILSCKNRLKMKHPILFYCIRKFAKKILYIFIPKRRKM